MKKNKMQKWNKILIWILVILMVLPTIAALSTLIWASEIGDLREELDAARQEQEERQKLIDDSKKQQEELEAGLETAKAELEKLKGEQASIFEQKSALDTQIGLLNEQIAVIDKTVAELQEGIDRYDEEIAGLSMQYDRIYACFKDRVRVAYEDGTASYLSVIFNADSIGDLIVRVQLVADILANDRGMMDELNILKETIELKSEALRSERAEYDAMTASLVTDREELQAAVDESIAVMSALEDEENASAELMEEYERLWREALEEEQRLVNEYNAAEADIYANEAALSSALESSRIAESKYLAWSISDSIAKEQNDKEPPEANGSSGGSSGSSSGSSGTYIWPTPGYYYVTSYFGGRYHPVTGVWQSHSGIDIGAPYGAKVVAIAGGRVIESGYSNIFGNCIRIDHGDGVISLYGHFCSPALYSVGEWVNQGATIGYVGSTGMSTGAHLHITTYQYGVLVNPLNLLTY